MLLYIVPDWHAQRHITPDPLPCSGSLEGTSRKTCLNDEVVRRPGAPGRCIHEGHVDSVPAYALRRAVSTDNSGSSAAPTDLHHDHEGPMRILKSSSGVHTLRTDSILFTYCSSRRLRRVVVSSSSASSLIGGASLPSPADALCVRWSSGSPSAPSGAIAGAGGSARWSKDRMTQGLPQLSSISGSSSGDRREAFSHRIHWSPTLLATAVLLEKLCSA